MWTRWIYSSLLRALMVGRHPPPSLRGSGDTVELEKNQIYPFLAAIVAGHVATYYNIPVTLWGVTFATTLSDDEMFPTVMSVVPNYKE